LLKTFTYLVQIFIIETNTTFALSLIEKLSLYNLVTENKLTSFTAHRCTAVLALHVFPLSPLNNFATNDALYDVRRLLFCDNLKLHPTRR